eukprot:4889178-Amphidinium_carterae.1
MQIEPPDNHCQLLDGLSSVCNRRAPAQWYLIRCTPNDALHAHCMLPFNLLNEGATVEMQSHVHKVAHLS